MKVLAYGDITENGVSAFTSVTKIDGSKLVVSFSGSIRTDNPYKHLSFYLKDLNELLPKEDIQVTVIDFSELKFCNSNGFYIIMDIAEFIYSVGKGPVKVIRLKDDDWHQETLPILIDIDEETISSRTSFEDVMEI